MKKTKKNIAPADLSVNVGQLGWLPANPRTWTQADVDRTSRSIAQDTDFLEDRPILAIQNEEGGYVVFAGNLRTTAAKGLALKSVPVVVYTPETEEDREAVKRRAMKDNGNFGAWDYDALANEWDDLPLAEFGVPTWNAEEPEGNESFPKEAKEDDFDEESGEIHVLCAKGDVWKLGEHILMCGDSTDLESVKKLMGGGEIKADMVFTDPPYGVSIGDKNKMLREHVGGKSITQNIENDTLSVEELHVILKKAMENARLNCKDDASYYVTAPQGGSLGLMMMMMMKEAGLEVRHNLIWRKNSATFSLGRLDYDYQHEPIMYTWTKSHHNYRKGKYRTTIWDFDKPRKCDLHPTMKPVALVANCMLDGTKEGDVVLDIFGGSGTTIIAAEQLGRRARVMELDPHYCDVIIARWEKLTGAKAEKI